MNDTRKPKEIHIVFKVLNFLHSQHHLAKITCPNEHRLLICLASHNGVKGICPSIPVLKRELKICERTVFNGLQKWKELGVIEIQSDPGKCNSYILNIPEPTPATGCTPVTTDTPATSCTPPLQPAAVTPATSGAIYNKEELRNNKRAFNMENGKHEFAHSMNQMANEQKHIKAHQEEKRTPMPDNLRRLLGIRKK